MWSLLGRFVRKLWQRDARGCLLSEHCDSHCEGWPDGDKDDDKGKPRTYLLSVIYLWLSYCIWGLQIASCQYLTASNYPRCLSLGLLNFVGTRCC